MLSFYPQQRFSYYPAGPAPAPAPSSRDRYLAALAEAKAAEEEYLRDQALQQEEAALQRRLQEIQLRKQQTSLRHPTNHATPFIPGYGRSYDFPYVQRQELEREAFQQAIAARQAQLEIAREQLAAQQLRETHQRAAQQLRQQIVSASPLQRRRSGCHCEPFQCQRACGTQLTRRPAFKRAQTPPESRSINVEVDLGQLLGFPSAHKPKTVTPPVRRASSTPASQPVKATPAKQHSEADAIQQVLDLFLGAEKPLPIPAPASQQSKTAPAQQAKPDNSLPREVEIDLSRGFEDFLSALGIAPRPQPQASTSSKAASYSSSTAPTAAAPAEASKTAEKVNIAATTQQAPESTEHVLKRELEARLNNEYEAEVRDTIQAIFASLHDNHTPAPSAPEAAPAPSSSSSDKGKTKIVIESPSEPTSKDIADALNEVRSIETAFTALESDFTFPAQLDFDLSTTSFDDAASVHSADSEGSASSHLAFTSRNHPIRFYEQALGSLLTQLDAVESFGNEELRKARKEVVAKVEKALDELEWEVQGRWRSKLAKESKASEASSPTEPVAAQETQSTTTVGTEEQEEAKQVNVVEAQAPEVQSPESVNVTATPVESSLAPVDVDAASDPVQSTTESEVLVQTVPEPVEEEVVPAVDDVPQDVEVALASNSAVTDEEVPAERALEVEDIVSEFASAPVETDAAPSPQEIPTLDAIIPALDESAVDGPSEPESSTSSLATSVATIKPQAYEVEESSESEAEAETEDAVDDDVESISEDDVDTFLLPSSKELEAQRKPRHDDESTSDWSEVEA